MGPRVGDVRADVAPDGHTGHAFDIGSRLGRAFLAVQPLAADKRQRRRPAGWNFTAAALYQFPNTSVGPDGTSFDYSRWSLWPELYASVKHVGERLTVGAGVDILSIMPRKTSTARRTAIVDGVETQAELTVCVRDRVTGISPEIFADYKSGLFNVKGKSDLRGRTRPTSP